MVTSPGKTISYTIGYDMSSRNIEEENPLYLTQAKNYDGCAYLGPCIYITQKPLDKNTKIYLEINRNNAKIFERNTIINQMKKPP